MLGYRTIRRILIAMAGATVVGVGVALLVLPGPGLVIIAVGLGVLGLEFAWARHWLRQMKATGGTVVDVIRNNVLGNGNNANGTDSAQEPDPSQASEFEAADADRRPAVSGAQQEGASQSAPCEHDVSPRSGSAEGARPVAGGSNCAERTGADASDSECSRGEGDGSQQQSRSRQSAQDVRAR